MILFINTTDFNNLHLALVDGNVKEFNTRVAFNENYKTNDLLEKFLKRSKVTMPDIAKVIVCSGPGSFTGIRVGVSMAQALGFALNIPVIAIPRGKVPKDLLRLHSIKASEKMTLNYGQKPNITKAKKKTRSLL
jgi:tRNA threonylcarbamoyladenosine biosynthesis protein TsaB